MDDVLRAFPMVPVMVQEALDRIEDYDWSDFLPEIRAARHQLWLGVLNKRAIAVVITRCEQRPRRAVGQILLVTGESRNLWFHHLSTIEDFFRSMGCEQSEPIARKGWVRDLPDYQVTHVVLRKAL